MQRELLVIGILFSEILLLMVNFCNLYKILTHLIRKLHDQVIRDNISPQDAERFLLQINRLRARLSLIGIVQSCRAMAFVMALTTMITACFDKNAVASMLFLGSIVLLVISMLSFTREIHIANKVLNVHLSDLQENEEWQKYLKPKRRRLTKAVKKA